MLLNLPKIIKLTKIVQNSFENYPKIIKNNLNYPKIIKKYYLKIVQKLFKNYLKIIKNYLNTGRVRRKKIRNMFEHET